MPPAAAAPLTELVAAYLFNFAQFVTWPREAPGALEICVPADSEYAHLNQLAGRSVRQMKLGLRWFGGDADLAGCHIVFLERPRQGQLEDLLGAIGKRPVLVVAAGQRAAALGAGVGIYPTEEGRLGFDLNLAAIEASGLHLNTRLLALARRVY